MTLTLPYPPSTNHAYTVANGRKIKSATARAYAHTVQRETHAQTFNTLEQWRPTRNDRLHVTVDVHAPDARRRDLANIEKLAVDAVALQLGFDDSQIDVLTLRRQPVDRTNPRLVLTLEAIA